MTPTPDFSGLVGAFSNTWVLGTQWLIPLALTTVIAFFITRESSTLKLIFFPLFVMELIIGIPVHIVILVVSAIVFVIELMSTQLIGKVYGKVSGPIKSGIGYSAGKTAGGIESYLDKRFKKKVLKDYEKSRLSEPNIGNIMRDLGVNRREYE